MVAFLPVPKLQAAILTAQLLEREKELTGNGRKWVPRGTSRRWPQKMHEATDVHSDRLVEKLDPLALK